MRSFFLPTIKLKKKIATWPVPGSLKKKETMYVKGMFAKPFIIKINQVMLQQSSSVRALIENALHITAPQIAGIRYLIRSKQKFEAQ